MNGAVPAIIALAITFLLSALMVRLAHRYKFGLTRPRDSDLHPEPVPRIGGLALFAGFLLTTLLWYAIVPDQLAAFHFPFALFGISIDKRLLGILLGAIVLVASMTVDDVKRLSPGWKLFWQVIVGLIVVASSIHIDFLRLPFGGGLSFTHWQWPLTLAGTTYHIAPLADLILIAWLVLLMNAINLVDGLDGLAASIGAVSTLIIILLALSSTVSQPAVALVGMIFLGSILGFLPWNWSRAKLFLGDSGAMLIGYILGVLSVIAGSKIATLGLVLGLPILDLAAVVIVRLARHQNPLTTPDKNHLHHRLLQAGFSVPQAVLVYVFAAALVGLFSLTVTTNGKFYAFFSTIIFLIAIIIGLAAISRRRLHAK